MLRGELFERLDGAEAPWEVAIVGGGATGLGCAVDAASRGYRTVLFERADFSQGTSSRSTKLVHGGVRYLRQGNVRLVLEALRERGRLLENAPGIVHPLAFIIPARGWWEKLWYGMGLFVYSLLARKLRIAWPAWLGSSETRERLPTLALERLSGGIEYWDGQFDDARLAVALARTAIDEGGLVINHCEVTGLLKTDDGMVAGVRIRDGLTGTEREVRSRIVVNATGVWTDALRREDDREARPMVTPSKGSHIVLPKKYLPGRTALLVPKTPDGRVVFAVPWHDRLIVGTTDIAMDEAPLEMKPTREEVKYIIETARPYLGEIDEADILSVYAGLRPLVSAGGGDRESSAISRDHTILASKSGLITVAGGKWTTYRHMAEEVIDGAEKAAGLGPVECRTMDLKLVSLADEKPAGEPYSEKLPIRRSDVERAARDEMAMTLDDVLSRRTRCLILDARETLRIAPEVARDLADVLGKEDAWAEEQVREFEKLANDYFVWGKS